MYSGCPTLEQRSARSWWKWSFSEVCAAFVRGPVLGIGLARGNQRFSRWLRLFALISGATIYLCHGRGQLPVVTRGRGCYPTIGPCSSIIREGGEQFKLNCGDFGINVLLSS